VVSLASFPALCQLLEQLRLPCCTALLYLPVLILLAYGLGLVVLVVFLYFSYFFLLFVFLIVTLLAAVLPFYSSQFSGFVPFW